MVASKISGQHGFSYLILLFTVAITAAGLGGTGILWHTAQQRQKEAELLFAGNQIRNAIASYYARTPGNLRRYPGSLEELLKDPRFPTTVRHLRKLYRDPISASAREPGEWGLIAAPGGGIMGVYSTSEAAPLKRAGFDLPNRVFEERTLTLGDKMSYREWQFVYIGAPPPGRLPRGAAPQPARPAAAR